MTADRGDPVDRDPRLRGGGDEAGAQRVSGEVTADPDPPRGALEDPRDVAAVEAGRLELAAERERAEDGPGRDHGGLEPVFEGPDRIDRRVGMTREADLRPLPLLVGLGAANPEDEPLRLELKVFDVEGDELATSQGPVESDEEERPITYPS